MAKVQQILGSLGIKSSSKTKAAVKATVAAAKPAAKATEQKGAEAMANQGRAMVHFTKPTEQELAKKNPRSLKAASGWGEGGDGWNY